MSLPGDENKEVGFRMPAAENAPSRQSGRLADNIDVLRFPPRRRAGKSIKTYCE